jgi:hypothetical protein
MSWRCASISDAGLEEERTHSLSLFQAPMPTTLSAAHSVPHVSTTAVAQICASGCDFSTASLEIVQSNKTAVLDHDLDHPWQWSEETPNAVHTSVDGEQALFEPFIKVTAETHDTLPIIEDTMVRRHVPLCSYTSPVAHTKKNSYRNTILPTTKTLPVRLTMVYPFLLPSLLQSTKTARITLYVKNHDDTPYLTRLIDVRIKGCTTLLLS